MSAETTADEYPDASLPRQQPPQQHLRTTPRAHRVLRVAIVGWPGWPGLPGRTIVGVEFGELLGVFSTQSDQFLARRFLGPVHPSAESRDFGREGS